MSTDARSTDTSSADVSVMHGHQPLSDNDLRQCLRIATGGALALLICKLLNLEYGSFFCVYPMLLLGLVPRLNAHLIRQFFAQGLVVSLEVALLYGLFGGRPLLMVPLVFLLFFYRFALMAKGPLFLFGALGSVFLSIQLNFASYPQTNVIDMLWYNSCAIFLAGAIAGLMFYLFPDVEPRAPRQPVSKDLPSRRHEALLGATVATLSFMVFQSLNLHDSLSAQVASILVLFPMHWKGVHFAGRVRAVGTLLGCTIALLMMLLLYNHHDVLPLVVLLVWIAAMFCARWHMLENGVPGIGFGALTTLAILFGQSLTPDHDIMYATLYRLSSVCIAVLLTLFSVFILHRLLNCFASTRHFSH
ncbi:Fusaric acid resistance protein-like [Pseudomonas segetis]|uniref:Fusaric acid resistance protein-like n=2 Tax=Pseudomonas segetis TaxID=298908 RepID=A0A239AKK4_9PSED|nr:Fusaric acid resistance protein-like [Pseudomonas segetis]